MTTLRPAITDNDDYIKKVVKYIPAEIITSYTALAGFLSVSSDNRIPDNYKTYYLIVLGLLTLITPVWTFYAVIDSQSPPASNKKYAFFHAGIALVAFLIWVYASGNLLLKAILCKCESTACIDCTVYSTVLGSIILLIFTISTPMLERIVLGTPLPGRKTEE